jgi:outer membrane lipoprotein-sorting protein
MKKRLFFLILMSAMLVNVAHALTQPDARTIMERVDARDDGDTMEGEMVMLLVDSRGGQRVRNLKSFRKDFEDVTKSLLFFVDPPDVRNTAFLTYQWENSQDDDDSWIFLPGLGGARRVATVDKSRSFLGSDFSYADMERLDLNDWDFELVGTSEKVGEHSCYKIEATPNHTRKNIVLEKFGYEKMLLWVSEDNYLTVKSQLFVKEGKRIKNMLSEKWRQIDGIWTPQEVIMQTTKAGRVEHTTGMRMMQVHYNANLNEDLFTTVRMRKGL